LGTTMSGLDAVVRDDCVAAFMNTATP